MYCAELLQLCMFLCAPWLVFTSSVRSGCTQGFIRPSQLFVGICMFTEVMKKISSDFFRIFFYSTFRVLLEARQVLISGFCWEKPELLPAPLPSSLAASLAGWWEAVFCILWVVQSVVLQQQRQLGLPGPLVLGSMSGGLFQNPDSRLN